jgi:hypothetical protein
MPFKSNDFSGVRLERLLEFCFRVEKTKQTPDLISLVASEKVFVEFCRKITDPNGKSQKRFAAMCRTNLIDPDDIRRRMKMVATVLGVYKQVDYYKVLGVPPNAGEQAIKKAYREKAHILHPDKAEPDDKDGLNFVKLHDAYAHLSDPKVRELYDQTRVGADWIEGSVSNRRSALGGGAGRFLSWVFILIGGVVIIAYAFDLYRDRRLTLFTDNFPSDLMGKRDAAPAQLSDESAAGGGLTIPQNDGPEMAALRKYFPEPTPFSVKPPEKPAETEDGFMFFNPRREQRYWAGEASRHYNLDDAVEALAKMYHRTPEWVMLHMGEENALQTIHQKLSAQQAAEKALAERTQIEEMPQDKDLILTLKQVPAPAAPLLVESEQPSEPASEGDQKNKPDAVAATLTKTKSATFSKKEKVTSNKLVVPAPKVESVKPMVPSIKKTASTDVTMRPRQNKPTALEAGASVYENPAAVKSKSTVAMPTAKPSVLKQVKSDPVDYIEKRRRVTEFLKAYTHAYEQRDLNRFKSFFAKGALEQGKQFEKMLPTYRKTFRLVEALKYHIEIKSLAIDGISKKISVEGVFTAGYRLPEKDWGSRSGSIRLVLLDTPRGLMVSRMDYEMGRAE